jgi:hypothetical protein
MVNVNFGMSRKKDFSVNTSQEKGVKDALDDMCHSLNFVAPGIDQRLHDGWGHSYPSGHRYRRGAGSSYSGTKTIVAVWTLAGEGEVCRAINHGEAGALSMGM